MNFLAFSVGQEANVCVKAVTTNIYTSLKSPEKSQKVARQAWFKLEKFFRKVIKKL